MSGVYFTIYYGFSRYEYVAKPPVFTRYEVSRKTGIPIDNIDVGVIGDIPEWKQPKKISDIALFFGKLLLSSKNKVRREMTPTGKRMMFLKDCGSNSFGDVVGVIEEDTSAVYYYDADGRWSYLLKSGRDVNYFTILE